MKLNHPAKRLTAALLSGAMLFTLSAPALAADPGTAPDTLPSAAAPLNEENGDGSVTFTIGGDANNYTFTTDRDTSFEEAGVSYTHADNTLTFTGTHESLTIDAPGVNVKITGTPDQTLVGKQGEPNSLVLEITNSASVYISNLQDGVTSGAQAIAGKAEIKSDGNVTIYGTDRAVGGAMLTVDAGGDVTITSSDGNAINCSGDVIIDCGGNVNITSTGSAIESREASITSGGDVTITSSDGYAISCYGAATINCSGNVTVNSSSATDFAVEGNALIIENAQDVTITAQKAIFHGYINSSAGFADSPAVRITCSGEVTLKSTGAGDTLLEGLHYIFDPGSASQTTSLTYNQANSYAYEVWAGNTLLTDVGEAGTSFTLLENTTYSSIHIIPGVPAPIIPDDGGDGGDGSGIAGAVVAGVAIGGAAAWGSYEIATRVILNDLLPEGAAIPANRGQLALLVWNTAGRPAPAAAPAFADVTDPDTAAAAQWCVEQSYLDAKKDGSFDPNGWTPKFRVIEVWNKAFPKQ